MLDRRPIVDENFRKRVSSQDLPPLEPCNLEAAGLSKAQLLELFETQALSRQLDFQARELQSQGEAFYTIGSAGHEGNAAIAAALRINDMAFLHYRDAAFMIQRSKQDPKQTIIKDMLLSFAASKDDPISAGRHKVLGSKSLFIPPQTSTIASHLPKAVGMASSIGINKHLKHDGAVPNDSVVVCSFGDASLNHSTSQGAINAACWSAHQKIHTPIIFVCEDNGIGISVRTPKNWVRASMEHRPGLRYIPCNGLDIVDTYRAAKEAADYSRKCRLPVFLHMSCVRLMGHAGSDGQHIYLTGSEIETTESHDPLIYTAARLIEQNILSAAEIIERYDAIRNEVVTISKEVITRPKLANSKEVMASIVPPSRAATVHKPSTEERERAFGRDYNQLDKPIHMSRIISWALTDLMLERDHIVVAGEDVGKKGGVYSCTFKLQARFGARRVIDSILDEQTILGLAIGMAQNNLLPIPEIQFLAYLHNAEDQIRGEAATLSFFSNGQYTNPMVIRIAGLAYQRGFGGHFHNDNGLAVLRDIPGVIVACPSHGADAVAMLRECVRLADEEQRVVVFLEPIALYTMKDLHEERDNLWADIYSKAYAQPAITYGQPHIHGDGTDLAIITYGNGYYLSHQAEKILADEHNINARVIDIRWLCPLHIDKIIEALGNTSNILIVDECRNAGSPSEELYTKLHEQLPTPAKLARITAEDSFIPLGKTATMTLPNKESIVEAALKLKKQSAIRLAK